MIKLVYDCIRDPYDIANILQVTLAMGDVALYFTGNSIRHDHPKVVSRIGSWSSKIRAEGYPNFNIHYYESLEDLARDFEEKKIRLIGTSPAAKKSFYALNLEENNFAIVFGTERSGLSKIKAAFMEDLVKIPMNNDVDFMTLSVITPIVSYEIARQQGRFAGEKN
jgi:tRNA G18 (ribose-2'-O)-methylase SpoU